MEHSTSPRLSEVAVQVRNEALSVSLQHVVEALLMHVVQAQVVAFLSENPTAEGQYFIHTSVLVEVNVEVSIFGVCAQCVSLLKGRRRRFTVFLSL